MHKRLRKEHDRMQLPSQKQEYTEGGASFMPPPLRLESTLDPKAPLETEQVRQEKNNVEPFRLEDYGYETKTTKARAVTPFNFQKYFKQQEQSKEENPSSVQLNAKGEVLQKKNDPCEDCDSFRFLIDNELKTLYGIAVHFKIDFDKLTQLNSHIKDYSRMQKGDTIFLPKGTLSAPKETPKEYDSFKFMVDNNLANLYRVAIHYKLDYNNLIEINSHIDDLNSMQEGLVIYLPKGTLTHASKPASGKAKTKESDTTKTGTGNREIAGDPNGKKTVLVSWTFDDGPHPNTDELRKKLGISNTTWFIVRKNMKKNTGGWEKNVEKYKEIQKSGGEVGIHAQHDEIDHIVWFPVNNTNDGYTTKGTEKYTAYDTMATAMKELKDFKKELNDEEINPKFVRLPGGLKSQLLYYTKHVGFPSKYQNDAANAVLKGKKFSSLGLSGEYKKGYDKIVADFNSMKLSLKSMGLLLWGGSSDPNKISSLSWNAESSGDTSLNDNITNHHHSGKKQIGKFEKAVSGMKNGDTKSFVILAHDTVTKHVNEILTDKAQMEKHASENSVKIEYMNMSNLFNKVTNKDVEKFSPNY